MKKTTININGLPVEFTDKKPTKPGAYWCREEPQRKVHLVSVFYDGESLFVQVAGALTATLVENVFALWSAQLVPVEEMDRCWDEAWESCEFKEEYEITLNAVTAWKKSRARRVVEGEEIR